MDRARQFFSKIRGQVSGWIVTGSIIAITGFTPQEWAARLVRLFPAIETEWLSGLDLRLVLVGLGTTIVVCTVLLQHRALRRLATVDGRGSATTADRQSAAPAGGETPVRVDRTKLDGEPRSPLLSGKELARAGPCGWARFQLLPIRTAREVFPQAAHPTRFFGRVMCRLGTGGHFHANVAAPGKGWIFQSQNSLSTP